jgi:hypothetical protein
MGKKRMNNIIGIKTHYTTELKMCANIIPT